MGPMREAVQLRLQEAKQHLITNFMCIHTFMTWFLPNTKHVEIRDQQHARLVGQEGKYLMNQTTTTTTTTKIQPGQSSPLVFKSNNLPLSKDVT